MDGRTKGLPRPQSSYPVNRDKVYSMTSGISSINFKVFNKFRSPFKTYICTYLPRDIRTSCSFDDIILQNVDIYFI